MLVRCLAENGVQYYKANKMGKDAGSNNSKHLLTLEKALALVKDSEVTEAEGFQEKNNILSKYRFFAPKGICGKVNRSSRILNGRITKNDNHVRIALSFSGHVSKSSWITEKSLEKVFLSPLQRSIENSSLDIFVHAFHNPMDRSAALSIYKAGITSYKPCRYTIDDIDAWHADNVFYYSKMIKARERVVQERYDFIVHANIGARYQSTLDDEMLQSAFYNNNKRLYFAGGIEKGIVKPIDDLYLGGRKAMLKVLQRVNDFPSWVLGLKKKDSPASGSYIEEYMDLNDFDFKIDPRLDIQIHGSQEYAREIRLSAGPATRPYRACRKGGREAPDELGREGQQEEERDIASLIKVCQYSLNNCINFFPEKSEKSRGRSQLDMTDPDLMRDWIEYTSHFPVSKGLHDIAKELHGSDRLCKVSYVESLDTSTREAFEASLVGGVSVAGVNSGSNGLVYNGDLLVYERMFDAADTAMADQVSASQIQKLHASLYGTEIPLKHVVFSMEHICADKSFCSRYEFKECMIEVHRRYCVIKNLGWEFSLFDTDLQGSISVPRARLLAESFLGSHFSALLWQYSFVNQRSISDRPVGFEELVGWILEQPSNDTDFHHEEQMVPQATRKRILEEIEAKSKFEEQEIRLSRTQLEGEIRRQKIHQQRLRDVDNARRAERKKLADQYRQFQEEDQKLRREQTENDTEVDKQVEEVAKLRKAAMRERTKKEQAERLEKEAEEQARLAKIRQEMEEKEANKIKALKEKMEKEGAEKKR
eukprot:UC4_evm1s44